MAFTAGEPIPGTKYRVVRELGAGGMGVVYHVVKPPGIEGVLKLMSKDLVATPEFRTRFFDEVRILAKLDHPNIVKVFDYDALPDGTPFYVMELLSGRTLRDALTTNGRLPPRAAYEVTKQLLEALHAAHTHDIPVVHRDIKPENIFLHAPKHGEPRVKLIDFGVIAVADRKHDGMFVGTWRYAAPEQIRGERATPATDLYAVGLLLYEMLSGKGPFDHLETGTDVAQAHLRQVPAPVTTFAPWVPPSVVQLINAALAKDPRGRPRDARAFAERLSDLERASDGAVRAVKTLEGVGEARKNATAPDEDALLEGLAARPDERVPSKKLRESGRQQLVTPSGSGQVVVRVDNDTFASQHSDARGVPKTSSMRIVLAILGVTAALLGVLLFVVVKNLRGAPTAPAAATSATSATSSATSPPVASSAPLPSPPAPVVSAAPPTATSVAVKPAPPTVVHPGTKVKPNATTTAAPPPTTTTPRDDFMRGGP